MVSRNSSELFFIAVSFLLKLEVACALITIAANSKKCSAWKKKVEKYRIFKFLCLTHRHVALVQTNFDELTVWCVLFVLVPRMIGVFPSVKDFAANEACGCVVIFAASGVKETGLSHLTNESAINNPLDSLNYLIIYLLYRAVFIFAVLPGLKRFFSNFFEEFQFFNQVVKLQNAFFTVVLVRKVHSDHFSKYISEFFCLFMILNWRGTKS